MKFLVLLFSVGVWAKGGEHRHHEGHVHGSAQLNLAFDDLQGKLEFKGAAEGVVGFEHEAKSEKDKKTLAEVVQKFENSLAQMVVFDSSLGCEFTKEKLGLQTEEKESKKAGTKKHRHHHAEHADFVAEFNIQCKSPVKGSTVKFDFTIFPRLKDIDVTFLMGDLQKSLEVKSKPVSLELK